MIRELVTQDELKEITARLRADDTFYIAGAAGVTCQSLGKKFLLEKVVKPWVGIDGTTQWLSPGEAARLELTTAFPDLKKVGWNKNHLSLFDRRVPLHFGGPAIGEMIYIDLVGAYHQIYRRLWLDTIWPRGYYGQYPLLGVADRLQPWKAARNAVIGICRSRSVVGIKGHKRITIATKNRFLSPGLWATVMDILHWVAGEALAAGAIYIHTDGYIFPGGVDRPGTFLFLDWLAQMHITFSVRAFGEGIIAGWNKYRIAKVQTAAFKHGLSGPQEAFTNVTEQTPKWGRFWKHTGRIIQASKGAQIEFR